MLLPKRALPAASRRVKRSVKPRRTDAPVRMQTTSNGLQLLNGDFEQGWQSDASVLQRPFEKLFGTVARGAAYVHTDRVVGWRTTGINGIIEFWYNGYSGAFANAGKTHAELNADQVSALYQDIDTIPGMLLYWALAHRGRAGVDVMELRIGPPNATVLQRQMSDGNTLWGRHSGTYIVPAQQFVTRCECSQWRRRCGAARRHGTATRAERATLPSRSAWR